MAQPEFRQPEQYSVTLVCRWCGHTGSSLWENAPSGKQMINLDGFYERIAKARSFRIETVCNGCGRVQPV